jgi:lipoyl-dependent peroxiredoxin
MLIEHVLYQAQVKATGGRDGRAVSSDGVLDVQLTTPRALGGAGGRGTNPEQLFAAGYAASFLSAMQYVAARDTLGDPAGDRGGGHGRGRRHPTGIRHRGRAADCAAGSLPS